MRIIKTILITAAVIFGLYYFAHIVGAEAFVNTDKYDGDCTGLETEGRCADKCPEGSYLMGYEHDGSALCKLNPTGCPYGDSIPLGPECDKQKPVEENQPTQQIETPADSALVYPDTEEGFGK